MEKVHTPFDPETISEDDYRRLLVRELRRHGQPLTPYPSEENIPKRLFWEFREMASGRGAYLEAADCIAARTEAGEEAFDAYLGRFASSGALARRNLDLSENERLVGAAHSIAARRILSERRARR